MARTASISRKTKETDIACEINIDGIGGAPPPPRSQQATAGGQASGAGAPRWHVGAGRRRPLAPRCGTHCVLQGERRVLRATAARPSRSVLTPRPPRQARTTSTRGSASLTTCSAPCPSTAASTSPSSDPRPPARSPARPPAAPCLPWGGARACAQLGRAAAPGLNGGARRRCKGDLHICDHHTAEDCALVVRAPATVPPPPAPGGGGGGGVLRGGAVLRSGSGAGAGGRGV